MYVIEISSLGLYALQTIFLPIFVKSAFLPSTVTMYTQTMLAQSVTDILLHFTLGQRLL